MREQRCDATRDARAEARCTSRDAMCDARCTCRGAMREQRRDARDPIPLWQRRRAEYLFGPRCTSRNAMCDARCTCRGAMREQRRDARGPIPLWQRRRAEYLFGPRCTSRDAMCDARCTSRGAMREQRRDARGPIPLWQRRRAKYPFGPRRRRQARDVIFTHLTGAVGGRDKTLGRCRERQGQLGARGASARDRGRLAVGGEGGRRRAQTERAGNNDLTANKPQTARPLFYFKI